ncbi:uncharacterized protein RJT21DRAFT_26353 [Scheffersomyces amazonensis]|uniref:uncharacterized protein n=1 Tax=Scheffersomyces amazonensis TaxID=1078765 RepID=UPI00315D4664
MQNLLTALSLSLIYNKRFVITTNNVETLQQDFIRIILENSCSVTPDQIQVIDLLEFTTERNLINQCTIPIGNEEDNEYEFKPYIIWKNLAKVDGQLQRYLYELITKIDLYDTKESRNNPRPCIIDGYSIRKPDLFIIIALLDHRSYYLKIDQYLKSKFWFSNNYVIDKSSSKPDRLTLPMNDFSYHDNIAYLRQLIPNVYIKPDIKRYIYSLVVHSRNHRLCSLAPRQTRLSTRSIDDIEDLARVMVLWQKFNNQNLTDSLYVTPDFVKVAMRKIGYWLIDWEYNKLFSNVNDNDDDNDNDEEQDEKDYRRRMEISMMTAYWYGSDYKYVTKYLDKSESLRDDSTPTGYSNVIVEDALKSVRPPI